MRIRVLAAVCAASIGIAACGGDDGDSAEEEAGPAEVTEQFVQALVAADADTACGLISEQGLKDLEASGGGTCEEAFDTEVSSLPEDAAKNADAASYEVIEETEDTATVEATRPGNDSETFNLVVEDGVWKIES